VSRIFLLDENVLIWPIESGGSSPGGVAAARLWCEIWRNCHRIALSRQLAAKYYNHLRRRRSKLSSFQSIPGFETAVQHVIYGKAHWVDDSQPVAEEKLIRHLNDRFLATVAVRCGACVVVSAERSGQVLEDFQRAEFSRLGIRAVDVAEALRLAGEPGDLPT
jgi:hypothetical protein